MCEVYDFLVRVVCFVGFYLGHCAFRLIILSKLIDWKDPLLSQIGFSSKTRSHCFEVFFLYFNVIALFISYIVFSLITSLLLSAVRHQQTNLVIHLHS